MLLAQEFNDDFLKFSIRAETKTVLTPQKEQASPVPHTNTCYPFAQPPPV